MVEVLKIKNNNIQSHIEKCLSSSNVCGAELRGSHYKLGFELGKQIFNERELKNKKVAILIMMRAGLPFGLGVADALENINDVGIMFSSTKDNDFSSYDVVIIADAVINTGKTILEVVEQIKSKTIIVATNVISDKHLDNLKELDIFATRISKHSYRGSNNTTISNGKGPDTGDRLFNNSFYKK